MNLSHRHKNVPAALLLLLFFAIACKQNARNNSAENNTATLADIETEYFTHGDFAKTFSLATSAQNNYHQKKQDRQEAQALLWMSSMKFVQGDYASTSLYLDQARPIISQTKNDSLTAVADLISGQLSTEKVQPDSAKKYFLQAENYIKDPRSGALKFKLIIDRITLNQQLRQAGKVDSLTALLLKSAPQSYQKGYEYALALTNRIQFFNDNGSPDSALRLCEKLTSLVDKSFSKNNFLQTLVCRSLSRSGLNQMDYDASLKYARKELVYAHQCNNAKELFDAYQDVLQAYSTNQDFKNALAFADSTDELRQRYFPEKSIEASSTYKLYTRLLENTHDYSKAGYYAKKSITLDRNIYGENSDGVADDYALIGNLFSYQGKYDSMLYYSQKVLKIRQATLPKDHLKIAFCMDDIARTYNNMDKPVFALPLQKEVERIYKKNYGPTHSYIAWAYDAEADSYGQLRQFDKAVQYNDAALGMFIPNMATDTGAINRTSAIPFDIYIPDYFSSRIQMYYNHGIHMSDKVSKIKYLQEAYRISIATNNYIQSYASHFDSPESVSVIYQRMYDVYRLCAETCFHLFDLTGDEKYRQAALNFSENKRGAFLRSSVLNSKSIKFSDIPAPVIEKEADLRSKITASADKSVPVDKKDSINKAYEQFLRMLSTKYANYYRLKYLPYQLTEKQIQQWLPDSSTTFAEYMFCQEHVFLFVVTKSKCSMVSIDRKDSIISKISGLSQLLKKGDLKTYYRNGYLVYNYLVEPLLKLVKLHSKIIISADGPLSTLSFEALPNFPMLSKFGGSATDFLIDEYNFSYAVSAFSLVNPFNKVESAKEKNRAFFSAPGFDNDLKNDYRRFAVNNQLPVDNNYMSYLYQPFMLKLGDKLSKTWRVTREEGSDATESNFKEKAAGNNIVQIGSHAILNDIDPMRSCLVFAKELSPSKNANDGYLYSSEIYNQKINADLVILTACETGVGQFKEGEGMMSLSYGFEYAGCKSAIMSLWPIDEQTASMITENFYRHLANGESTSDALYHAKKDFLMTADGGFVNPFYWSGLVLLGQNEKIQLEKKAGMGQYAWILGIIGITAAGAYGISKWRSSRAA